MQLGETGPLDPAALVPRLLSEGRGGYCFELNTVLGWLLQELGFSLTHHQAVVGGVGPTNHMVLVVDLGGEPWIADAGLGEGFLDPLPLVPGPHDFGPFRWTVELEACGTWWVASHDWCSFPGFRMERGSVAGERVRAASPSSRHRPRVAVRQDAGGAAAACGPDRRRSARGPCRSSGRGWTSKRVVADEAEFYAVLRGEFGVTRRDPRLWAQACVQHEAFLARSAV